MSVIIIRNILLLLFVISCSIENKQDVEGFIENNDSGPSNDTGQPSGPSESPLSSKSFILQAESANLNKAHIVTNQPGFHGTGFADYLGNDSSISWTVDYPPGFYQITVRYGNGSDRPATLIINDSTRINLKFSVQGTSNWSEWVTETTSIFRVNEEVKTIVIAADEKSSGPNLDQIEVLWGKSESDFPDSSSNEGNETSNITNLFSASDIICLNSLQAGEKMETGQFVCSQNKSYYFGIVGAPEDNIRKKLALIDSNSLVLWSQNIHEASNRILIEGKNLVVKRSFGNPESSDPLIWSSMTSPSAINVKLKVENNGSAVLLDENDVVVWTSDATKAGSSEVQTGQTHDIPTLTDIPNKGSSLRLASWNIFQSSVWPKATASDDESYKQTNSEKLGRVMRTLDADIWAFQEALYGEAQVKRATPTELKADLDKHTGQNFSVASDLGGNGLFLAVKNGINIITHGKIKWYHKDDLARRNYAYILERAGKKIVILNTHFIGSFDDQTRAAAKFISDIVNGEFENNSLVLFSRSVAMGPLSASPPVKIPRNATILVVGDFNLNRTKNEYRKVISSSPTLTSSSFYVPLMTDLNPKKINTTSSSNIDYILLKTNEYSVVNTFIIDAKRMSSSTLSSNGLQVNDTALKQNDGNDHLPHIVDLNLN